MTRHEATVGRDASKMSAARRRQDEQVSQALGGIRALSRAVLDDTKAEADELVAQAQRAARALHLNAEDQAQQVRAEILAQAEAEIAHLEQRTLATSRLEAQRILLTRREELIEEVFRRASERLGELRRAPGYKQALLDLIEDAVIQLGEPPSAVVRLDPRDVGLLVDDDLAQLAARWRGRVRLSRGEPIAISGGVVLEAQDGHQRYDNSFEQRLALQRAQLRAEVHRLLQGAA